MEQLIASLIMKNERVEESVMTVELEAAGYKKEDAVDFLVGLINKGVVEIEEDHQGKIVFLAGNREELSRLTR